MGYYCQSVRRAAAAIRIRGRSDRLKRSWHMTRQAAATLLRSVDDKRTGAGEEHERRRAGLSRARESGGARRAARAHGPVLTARSDLHARTAECRRAAADSPISTGPAWHGLLFSCRRFQLTLFSIDPPLQQLTILTWQSPLSSWNVAHDLHDAKPAVWLSPQADHATDHSGS